MASIVHLPRMVAARRCTPSPPGSRTASRADAHALRRANSPATPARRLVDHALDRTPYFGPSLLPAATTGRRSGSPSQCSPTSAREPPTSSPDVAGATSTSVALQQRKRFDPLWRETYEGAFEYSNSFFRYVGSMKNDKPCGYGCMYLADGGSVEGYFDEAGELTCSTGCRRWPDGSTYVGPMLGGEPHGDEGRYVGINGDVYEGAFRAGFRDGQGTLRNRATGLTYVGEWAHGLYHGHGTLESRELQVEGPFVRNRPHGSHLRLVYGNGDTYTGPVTDGVPGAPSGNINGVFTSAATRVTYHGPMDRGARSLPSDIVIREFLVHGSPFVELVSAAGLRRKGSTPNLTPTAKGARDSSPARAAGSRPGSSGLGASMSASHANLLTTSEADTPKYLGQLRRSKDGFISATHGKSIRVVVAMAAPPRRSMFAAVRLAQHRVVPQAVAAQEGTEHCRETGRTLTMAAYPCPPDLRAVGDLREYHARVAPSPVLMYSADELAALLAPPPPPPPNQEVTLASSTLARSTSTRGRGGRKTNRSRTSSVVGAKSAAVRAPTPVRPKPSLSSVAVVLEEGVGTFDVAIAEPGYYYLRFAPASSSVAIVPGDNASLKDHALADVAGYLPMRLVKQH